MNLLHPESDPFFLASNRNEWKIHHKCTIVLVSIGCCKDI
jgi:hypothetical protein